MSQAYEITNKLLVEISKRFPDARVWRVNVSAFVVGGRMVRANHVGMADISGIIGPSGRRLEIEVKAGRDRLSAAQISWGRMIEKHGGIFLVARDVEKTLADLQFRLTAVTIR